MSGGRKPWLLLAAWVLFLSAVVGVAFAVTRPHPPERSRGDMVAAVLNEQAQVGQPDEWISIAPVHAAVVGTDKVTWYDGAGRIWQTPVGDRSNIVGLFDQRGYTNYREDTGVPLSTIALVVGPMAVFILVMVVLARRGAGSGAMSLLRRSAGVTVDRPDTRFADVAACDEAKLELQEVVEFLRAPDRFRALGARAPKGVLMVGPPGTGKTLLSRAVAGEAECGFIAVSGAEFVELFVGVGAARVRDLFRRAKEQSPCIIFVDEIDAVGRRRGSTGALHTNDERESTLNQLLVEMDGFDQSSQIVVIAATNRIDVLDEALVRAGRFDRQVAVDAPDLRGREAILRLHAAGKPLAGAVDLQVVARRTPGFTGADLANLVNEAALLASRAGATAIAMTHIEAAVDRVIAGPERRGRLLSPADRRVIAYHEMGHALVLATLEHTDRVHKVTIVRRGQALGATMTLPEDDRVLGSRVQLIDQLAGLLGGRCAEELVFGSDNITTGAADDISKATSIAVRMVTEFGMSPLGLRALSGAELGNPRPHSEELAAMVDLAVDRLLADAAERARTVLRTRRALLDELASRLLEVETLDAEELEAIITRHPAPTPRPAAATPWRDLRPITARRGSDGGSGAVPGSGSGTTAGASAAATASAGPRPSLAGMLARAVREWLAGGPGTAA